MATLQAFRPRWTWAVGVRLEVWRKVYIKYLAHARRRWSGLGYRGKRMFNHVVEDKPSRKHGPIFPWSARS